MDTHARHHLETLLDRAVAPVQASAAAKRKMREELLAHVLSVFEEELARLGDESAALQRTTERFGDPEILAGELQRACKPLLVNHARLYNLLVIVLWAHTLIGVGLLAMVMNLAPEARPPMLAPSWILPILLAVNGIYLAVMTATLIARLGRFESRVWMTRILNVFLLIAPPFGTAIGVYGLWNASRSLDNLAWAEKGDAE